MRADACEETNDRSEARPDASSLHDDSPEASVELMKARDELSEAPIDSSVDGSESQQWLQPQAAPQTTEGDALIPMQLAVHALCPQVIAAASQLVAPTQPR